MRKLILLITALVFAFSLFGFQKVNDVKAVDTGNTVVAFQNLNCRSGPSIQHKLLGVLKAETTVKVLGKAENSGRNYFKVQLKDGTQCWVIGSSVKFYGDLTKVPVATFPKAEIRAASGSDWSGAWTIQLSSDGENPEGSKYSVPVVIAQDGLSVSFTIFSAGHLNYYTGTISDDGKSVTGTMGDRRFHFYRSATNLDQFQGRWESAESSDYYGMMCGYRNKSWVPNPCLK